MATATVCDGCGEVLPSRARREDVQGWRRHSLNWNGRLHVTHTCPACPDTAGRDALMARTGQ